MVITGVIRPPPEIRAVADRTASYVAKNGRAFEQRILGSAKGKTPKFAFLQTSSPFHAYYEDRIKFYAEGGDDSDDKEKKDGSGDKTNEGGDQVAVASKEKAATVATKKKTMSAVIDPIAHIAEADPAAYGATP